MEREFPGIEVCGTYAPPFDATFSSAENDRMLEAVNRTEPDVLWVGMTAPKQEKWIHANRHLLRVPLVGAVGAVFDFYSGTKPRCPAFWQNAGLEWFYRLVREPRRLWERTVLSAPRFLAMVLRERLRPARLSAASPVARPKCGKRPC
jgi:N-acetylglucosaminyldiphosphoundecaprenol N-acetyl-beta-D-mannosaminyltransferase